MKLDELTQAELHVVWVATAQYLVEVMTGETVIITDSEAWKKNLNNAVVKMARRLEHGESGDGG